jgi:hypothetical protein
LLNGHGMLAYVSVSIAGEDISQFYHRSLPL